MRPVGSLAMRNCVGWWFQRRWSGRDRIFLWFYKGM